MREVILDTSFILSCVRNKIDFLEEIRLMGFRGLVIQKVVDELKKSKKKEAKISLKLLEKEKIVELGKTYADKQIINFAKKNPNMLVATLDRKLKESVKNKKLIILGKKKLEVIS